MSAEINLSYSLAVQNPAPGATLATGQIPFKDGPHTDQLQLTQSAVGMAAEAVSIPTTAGGTAVTTTGVTTAGYMLVRNLDPTNFVQLGVKPAATFYPLVRLKAGEVAIFRLDSAATLYALADTAAVVIQYRLYNN